MGQALLTNQGSYEAMRETVPATDDSAIASRDFADRPSDVLSMTPEWNGIELYFESPSDATDNFSGGIRLWGGAAGGPTEFVADLSVTAGAATIGGVATALYIDTIVIAEQEHISNLTVSDSANNRIAKIMFDVLGFEFLYLDAYDISMSIQGRARPL